VGNERVSKAVARLRYRCSYGAVTSVAQLRTTGNVRIEQLKTQNA